jgi:hypothetical protein
MRSGMIHFSTCSAIWRQRFAKRLSFGTTAARASAHGRARCRASQAGVLQLHWRALQGRPLLSGLERWDIGNRHHETCSDSVSSGGRTVRSASFHRDDSRLTPPRELERRRR